MQQACALISGFVVSSFWDPSEGAGSYNKSLHFKEKKVPLMLLFNKLSCLNLGTSNFWNGSIYILQRQWLDFSIQ